LKHPKGIRDISEWYMSTTTRRDYVLGDCIDVINICGTDFGTQNSSFCSVATFRELWMPYYQRVNNWIHKHTKWRTFKHSCGAVAKFIPSFIESGFDILNPVQCSASGMDPETLKASYGDCIVFWGGSVDTQRVLPFGTPQEVREQVLRRCEIFAPGGGYVFCLIHNIQAETPVVNTVAMFEALRQRFR
jgi:uroporphyrinogen-III decarboxylase